MIKSIHAHTHTYTHLIIGTFINNATVFVDIFF